jgi:subtilisin-like proprotein convertase family protein
MKQILTLMTVLAVTTAAWGQQIITTNITVNTVVPDNNPSGLATAFTISGVSGAISNVTVSLDVTGGFNGDLYAYLAGPGGFAVLLNRSGVSGTSTYGYSDAGFNVTLNDASGYNNIHSYQNYSYTISGGQLTGNWASDGGNISPLSSPSSFPTAPTETLSSFQNTDANGQWVFFIADLSPGGQSTLQSFGVTILTVPEPSTLVLASLGGLGMLAMMRRRKV